MTAIKPPVVDATSFIALRESFERALNDGRTADVNRLLRQLDDHTAAAVASRDRREIVELRGKLARLRLRLEDRRPHDVSAVFVTLASLDRVLDSGANVALMYDHARRRQESREVLQDSVLRLLADGKALRPKDIAERLDTGPSQISRVLRRLLEGGAITKSSRPSRDGRANWYTRVETADLAA